MLVGGAPSPQVSGELECLWYLCDCELVASLCIYPL